MDKVAENKSFGVKKEHFIKRLSKAYISLISSRNTWNSPSNSVRASTRHTVAKISYYTYYYITLSSDYELLLLSDLTRGYITAE